MKPSIIKNIKADHFFLLVASSTVFLLSLFIFNLPAGTLKSSKTNQSAPELAAIMSPNQDARLKATRALAERVGVENALEIVKNANLPATGESHLAVHQIGFYAYKKYGVEAILHCRDYYLYACYHGAIIEAATDQGPSVISEMTDRCRSSGSRYFQCVHAAGHAIMAIHDYNLENALTNCDELYEKQPELGETLTSCHNGAFMENIFGVHDWGTDQTPKRDWLSNDPYFPCNYFGEKYQKGCWLNQASRIYGLVGGDLVKVAQSCENVPNSQHKAWCFDNLARQIHPLTAGNVDKVFELCKTVGSAWETDCITVNAISYASVGDPGLARQICQRLENNIKKSCLSSIASF